MFLSGRTVAVTAAAGFDCDISKHSIGGFGSPRGYPTFHGLGESASDSRRDSKSVAADETAGSFESTSTRMSL